MTGGELQHQDVFEGCDAYGRQIASPWQPAHSNAGEKTDIAVRFDGKDRLPQEASTVQRAVDIAVAQGPKNSGPTIIDIGPGFFEGPVIIPHGAPPMVLRGAGAGKTIIAAPIDARMSGLEYAQRFHSTISRAGALSKADFAQITARNHINTVNTAVLRVANNDVHISGLTIRNDYACDRASAAPDGDVPDVEGRFARGQHQAVALMLDRVDRITIRDCVLTSFQDTLFLRGSVGAITRAYFETCHIEGDVDFIFGGATALFRRCTVQSRGLRGAQSWALAPSTPLHQAFGFVFQDCAFTHDGAGSGQNGQYFLGRQWFEGVRATPYGRPTIDGYSCQLGDVNRLASPVGSITRQTLEAVGKAVVTQSTLGTHLNTARLWDDWSAGLWSPRYRPVQRGGSDFLRFLEDWLKTNELEYAAALRDQTWLQNAP